jgi:hypothetical protein
LTLLLLRIYATHNEYEESQSQLTDRGFGRIQGGLERIGRSEYERIPIEELSLIFICFL